MWFKASLLFQLTALFTRRNLLLNYCLNDQAPPQITKIPLILCINILNILYTPRLIHSPCLFRILELVKISSSFLFSFSKSESIQFLRFLLLCLKLLKEPYNFDKSRGVKTSVIDVQWNLGKVHFKLGSIYAAMKSVFCRRDNWNSTDNVVLLSWEWKMQWKLLRLC